ncbi:hypothetical protein FG152_22235 [Ochrobactrum sp. XJ1]|nr:hypothetical protein [Ochrobactrum sp. XJ1]
MKKRIHEFVIRLSFDKACSPSSALRAARDCIHGTHYTVAWNDGDPEIVRVKTLKHKPKGDQT